MNDEPTTRAGIHGVSPSTSSTPGVPATHEGEAGTDPASPSPAHLAARQYAGALSRIRGTAQMFLALGLYADWDAMCDLEQRLIHRASQECGGPLMVG